MVLRKWKGCLYAFAAAIVATAAFAFVYAANVSKLCAYEGKHVYYLDSASSQSLQKTELCGLDFLRVRGESVYIEGAQGEDFVRKVLQEERARVLWVEEVCGVTSYYCYTPTRRESVFLFGRRVNLHVAVSDNGCVIGCPMIFGGY